MSELEVETVWSRNNITKKRISEPKRPTTRYINLYFSSEGHRLYYDVCQRTGTPMKGKLKENTIRSGNDIVAHSLQDLFNKLENCNDEDCDSYTNGNQTVSRNSKSEEITKFRSECNNNVTARIQSCDVGITSHGLAEVTHIKDEYRYSFTIDIENSHEHCEQRSGFKRNDSKPKTSFEIIFRKCARSLNVDDVLCQFASRKKGKSKSEKSQNRNISLRINVGSLTNLDRLTSIEYCGNPSNYRPVGLGRRDCELLLHRPYISVTPEIYRIQENQHNAQFLSSLFSLLILPTESSLFTNGSDCISSTNGVLPTIEEELESERKDDGNKTENENRTDDVSTSEHDKEHDNADGISEIDHLTPNSIDRVSSEPGVCDELFNHRSCPESQAEPVLSGHTESQAEPVLSGHTESQAETILSGHTENQTESGEDVQSTNSDVTSELELLGTASGGNDRPTYSPRNPQYTTLESRRLSFRTWIREHDNIDTLMDCGFFFTDEEDIVRCFHCDIGLAEWDPNDDPWVEHARHSPNCPFLRSRKDADFINNIQLEWAMIYTPKHPHMDTTRKREETFRNSWPRDFVVQTPCQLAEAGFFYTGVTDTVRCHYCDGGLREWEPNDDPWTEHARWFPFCKFVVKVKGLSFIQLSAVPEDVADGNDVDVPAAVTQRIDSVPTFVDKCKERESRNPLLSAAAESLLSMGYSKETVKEAMMIHIERTGRRDCSAVDLMEITFELEDLGRVVFSEDTDTISEEDDFQLTPKALRMENAYLKKMVLCVTCKERERCMLFIPCGHRLTCGMCSEGQRTCPSCLSEVTSIVKTFLG